MKLWIFYKSIVDGKKKKINFKMKIFFFISRNECTFLKEVKFIYGKKIFFFLTKIFF
jgi:hypothetical protein